MSFYQYYPDIPAAGNNPSNDQPLMEVNTNSAAAIWLQDHYGFNDVNNLGGDHKQVTFAKTSVGNNVPSGLINPNSAMYTNAGLADPASPQALFTNSIGIFPMSALRAFGVFPTLTTPGPDTTTATNYFNITPVINHTVSGSANFYDITLNSTVITGSDIIVIATSKTSLTNVKWNLTAPLNLRLTFTSTSDVISFIVLQF